MKFGLPLYSSFICHLCSSRPAVYNMPAPRVSSSKLTRPGFSSNSALPALCPRSSPLRPRFGRDGGHTSHAAPEKGESYANPVFAEFEAAAAALQAVEEYKFLMQQPEPELLTGAALIAQHRYPLLDFDDDVFNVIEDLAEQIRPRLPAEHYPLKVLNSISDCLYRSTPRPFSGNDDYYHPDNSCINAVLQRRLGIPITLSLVYMEVARRCGIELYGINIPGHFLLSPADEELEFFVDAFDGGQVVFLDDAEETLGRIYGRPVKLDPAFLRRKEQIPSRVFLTRMLNNLKAVYAAKKNYSAAYSVSCYLRATRPGDLEELKEAGFILWHLKRYVECAEILREFLQRSPEDAKDVPKVARILQSLENSPDIRDD
jgi:regulator of sirC expression with transglutaminase-like and TPR domain